MGEEYKVQVPVVVTGYLCHQGHLLVRIPSLQSILPSEF
jgi:hypothetical protein